MVTGIIINAVVSKEDEQGVIEITLLLGEFDEVPNAVVHEAVGVVLLNGLKAVAGDIDVRSVAFKILVILRNGIGTVVPGGLDDGKKGLLFSF